MGWTQPTDLQKLDLGVSANLYRFTSPFDNQNNIPSFVYAPIIEGSYYVKLDTQPWRRLLKNGQPKYQYVSVSFLDALRYSRINWGDLLQKVDLSTVTAARQQEQIQKEEQFIRTFRDSWVDASFQLTANQNVKFPARADDGRADCVLCTTLLNNAKNGNDLKYAWQNELKQLWIRPSPGGSSKPPRYTAVSLVYPLVICIEEAGRKRFNDAVKVFETCIKMINEDGMTYKCKLQLGLRKDKQVGFPEDLKGYYRPLSTDPFGLYTTYIHGDDWHTYMNGLAAGGDPSIRQFMKTPSKEMETVNKAYAKRGGAIREIIGKLLVQAKIGKYSDWPEATKKAIQRLDASTDHFNRYPDYILGRWGELSAAKTKSAVGKRDQEDDQKAVMGESAPVVADSIGWKWNKIPGMNDRQMVNSLYIGEWLHISAFGWGGFLDFNSTNQGSTSQMPENLVLGTSETNALMTRYEYAWQGLFRDEEALHKAVAGEANTVRGMLDLYCNLTDVPIKYDVLEGARDVQQGPLLTYGKTTTANLRDIAKKYPWVAYTISYDVYMFKKSYTLDRDLPSCHTVFYPFMRPFIHKAEDKLDKLLYAEMKKLAKAAIEKSTGEKIVLEDEKTG